MHLGEEERSKSPVHPINEELSRFRFAIASRLNTTQPQRRILIFADPSVPIPTWRNLKTDRRLIGKPPLIVFYHSNSSISPLSLFPYKKTESIWSLNSRDVTLNGARVTKLKISSAACWIAIYMIRLRCGEREVDLSPVRRNRWREKGGESYRVWLCVWG